MRQLSVKIGQLALMRDRLSGYPIGDENRKAFYHGVSGLIDELLLMNLNTIDVLGLDNVKKAIDLSHKWLLSLMDSADDVDHTITMAVINTIGHEWISNYDEYVTLFMDAGGGFAFEPYWDSTKTKIEAVEKYFGVSLGKKPIYVYIPLDQRTDMFMGAQVLHEMGHCYDYCIGVSSKALDYLINQGKSDQEKIDILKKYFPDLINIVDATVKGAILVNGVYYKIEFKRMLLYIGEYIADLFAAQYTGSNFFTYADYIPHNSMGGDNHPTDDERREIVKDFVDDSKSNILLESIIHAFSITGHPLSKATDIKADASCLLSGKTIPLESSAELYASFGHAWNVHGKGKDAMESAKGLAHDKITDSQFYYELNKSYMNSIKQYLDNAK